VIFQEGKGILGYSIVLTGGNSKEASEVSLENALRHSNLAEKDIDYIISTGCGREIVTQSKERVTEITCLARGVNYLFSDCRTVIDIGGQDTKVLQIDNAGRVLAFDMNDKCAAGTGRFLGAAASALDIPLPDLGPTALRGERPVKISTTCTVFAESEVLSWLGKGKKIEDILLGVHQSIATRSVGLLRRVGIEPEVTFTGGVARNRAMIEALQDKLGAAVNVSDESHYMGALGAALFALDHILAGRAPAAKGAA
jgi:predicted CoA-substrate-specific enzyme activase